MKKILAIVLAAVMVLGLAACGGSSAPAATDAPAQTQAAAPAQTEAPAASGETISLTLWGAEEDQALLSELVEKFKAAYSSQTFDI